MNEILKRRPKGERMISRKSCGKSPTGESIIAQIETCGRQVRLLVTVGSTLFHTSRAGSASAIELNTLPFVLDEIATSVPAYVAAA